MIIFNAFAKLFRNNMNKRYLCRANHADYYDKQNIYND